MQHGSKAIDWIFSLDMIIGDYQYQLKKQQNHLTNWYDFFGGQKGINIVIAKFLGYRYVKNDLNSSMPRSNLELLP